jgi:energy-coupling factor transport system permease protein
MHKLSYLPTDTVFHRIYPLTKFFWLILGTILILLLTKGILLVSISLLCLLVLHFIYQDIWRVRGFRFVFLTGLFLFILYVLFEKSGRVLWNSGPGIFMVTTGGLEMGLRFCGRFLAVVFLSYIFILTTSPNDLAYSLMKAGIPYRYGFMLVTALRLSPILEEEGRTIYRAQLVRGVQYEKSGFRKLFLLVRQFMTPLLISALRRTDKLVFSMEGRGFGIHPDRTFRQQSSLTKVDAATWVVMVLLSASLLVLNYGGML